MKMMCGKCNKGFKFETEDEKPSACPACGAHWSK